MIRLSLSGESMQPSKLQSAIRTYVLMPWHRLLQNKAKQNKARAEPSQERHPNKTMEAMKIKGASNLR